MIDVNIVIDGLMFLSLQIHIDDVKLSIVNGGNEADSSHLKVSINSCFARETSWMGRSLKLKRNGWGPSFKYWNTCVFVLQWSQKTFGWIIESFLPVCQHVGEVRKLHRVSLRKILPELNLIFRP